ncbi:uncharacterized protein LOC118092826 isoform X1 [Zootoca vivipara]|uniref:uncharacterized protein LOC118092826 isoform X1 n=1 Tax=Zootoca vivipara TaxID=8524 RepID=UPI00293BB877|nr:uncharacterized protein LOC118092826 isoform X1 [Zootoca vivipara]
MGRLDDHAKKRIVELRKAGLSFRKIKKVLELDNIRVTPQAIYLFLKRKNVEPSQPPPVSFLQPALENGSRKTLADQAGWEDNQLWKLLQENETEHHGQREAAGSVAGVGPSYEVPPCNGHCDGEEHIKIISVTSLSKDGGQFGKQRASHEGLSSGSQLSQNMGDNCPGPKPSVSPSCLTPFAPAVPQHNLNGKGKAFLPPARNPALIVKRKIVGRAIHLHKKANVQNGQNSSGSTPGLPFMVRVQPTGHPSRETTPVPIASSGCSAHTKDASTQTCTFNPTYPPVHQNAQWGAQMTTSLVPAANSQPLAEKLDTVHTEVQKLAQAVHMVLERQCRLERQQEQQQRFQQELLITLQQLSSTVGHGAVPAHAPCTPYSVADPSPPLPSFSQFKMELI